MIGLQTEQIGLTKKQYAIYSCLCYFDVFNYPLKTCQVLDFVNFETNQTQVNLILNELIELKLVSEADGYYFLETAERGLIKTRTTSEANFYKRQQKIKRYANFIARFPFVRSVSISGSCSKGLLDEEDGDVDYFIIAAPNKLWLCRTLLIAFKKVFLFNSKKYFCINYLIDSNNLEIPDKNTFVATEIRTLLPVSGKEVFERFQSVNKWTNDHLPNKKRYDTSFLDHKNTKRYVFGFVEFLLKGGLGDALDKKCFELTLGSWQKKFPNFSKEDFDLNLRSRKNVSKHHPRGYQQKVMAALNARLEKIKVVNV